MTVPAESVPAGGAVDPVTGREPLGPTARRVWTWHRLHPASPAYNVLRTVLVHGSVDLAALREAMTGLARRHEALRAAVVEPTPGAPVVVVRDTVPVDLRDEVLGDARPGPADIERALRAVAEEPFDMTRAPLWRVGAVRTADGRRTWLALVMHHVVSDLRTTDVVLAELAALYGAATGKGTAPVDAAPSLLGHLAADAARSSDPRRAGDLAWWTAHLADVDPPPPVPFVPVPAEPPDAPADVSTRTLDAEQTALVTAAARRARTSPVTLLVAATAAVVHAWTGSSGPQLVGLPSVRRPRSADDGLVAFMLDTVVLRLDIDETTRFADLREQTRDRFLSALEHSAAPYDEVARAVTATWDDQPLLRVWVNDLSHAALPADLGGLPLEEWAHPPFGALFDVNVTLRRAATGELLVHLATAAGSARAVDAAALLDQVVALLLTGAADPDVQARPQVTPGRPGAAPSGGGPWTGPPSRHPDVPARPRPPADAQPVLLDGHGALDADALDAAVEALAAGLRAARGARVVVPARRDRASVLRLLACRRVGVHPVLVDASWPDATRAAAARAVAPAAAFPWDSDAGAVVLPDATAAAAAVGAPSHVLFTSGTTGDPLAVLVDSALVDAEVGRLAALLDVGPGDRVALVSGPAHDVGLRELLLAVLTGATLCIPPPGVLADPSALLAWLQRTGVTVLNSTPPMLGLVLGVGDTELPALRVVVSSGAPLPEATVRLVGRRAPGAVVVNGYGCTETPQLATADLVRPDAPTSSACVGTPVGGRRVEVRRPDGAEAPVGVPGEVWVAAPGIAHGYVGTGPHERFVTDGDGLRWFRTGDAARRDATGRLHLVGRLDRQVLVNGHRVALESVESVARATPGVGQAVAVLVDGAGGGGSLALWVEADRSTAPVVADEVRARLREQLPPAALPSRVEVVGRLPRDHNGKVRAPVGTAPGPSPATGTAMPADLGPLEARAVLLAKRVLGGPVGPDTSFFAAGMSSLMLLQLTAELEALLHRPVPAVAPFRHPTLRRLLRSVLAADAPQAVVTRPDQRRDAGSDRRASRRAVRAYLDEHTSPRPPTPDGTRPDGLRDR